MCSPPLVPACRPLTWAAQGGDKRGCPVGGGMLGAMATGRREDKHPRGDAAGGVLQGRRAPCGDKAGGEEFGAGDGLGARGQEAERAGRRGARCARDEGSQGCSSL